MHGTREGSCCCTPAYASTAARSPCRVRRRHQRLVVGQRSRRLGGPPRLLQEAAQLLLAGGTQVGGDLGSLWVGGRSTPGKLFTLALSVITGSAEVCFTCMYICIYLYIFLAAGGEAPSWRTVLLAATPPAASPLPPVPESPARPAALPAGAASPPHAAVHDERESRRACRGCCPRRCRLRARRQLSAGWRRAC